MPGPLPPTIVSAGPEGPAAPAHDEKGTIWPFVVFLCLAFFGASPVFLLSYFGVHESMQGMLRAFQEGGIFMYLLIVCQFFAVVVYCGLSYFHIVSGKLPASILLIPVSFLLIPGILATKFGVDQAASAIDLAAPERAALYALRGLAIASQTKIMGVLVAASATGMAALMAAMRVQAWVRGARRPMAGWIILAGGFLVCAGTMALTCFSRDSGLLAVPIGVAALGSALFIGLGSAAPTSTWKDGANRLLLIVASLSTVGLVWYAMRTGGFVLWANLVDMGTPDQQFALIVRGAAITAQIDLAGTACLIAVSLLAVAALVTGGSNVLAGAARFRISAAILVLSFGAPLAATVSLRAAENDLVDRADRIDVSYFARHNDGFQPATSPSSSPVRRLLPTIIVNPGVIWVDDQQVGPTQGFLAKGASGQSLRAALSKSISAWEAKQRQAYERNVVQLEEIEDWVNQDRTDDKRSDNRYGIKGPGHSPVDLLKQDPPGPPREPWQVEAVTLAIHRDVPFSTTREVIALLRELNIPWIRFLVGTPLGLSRRSAEELAMVPERYRSMARDYGVIEVAIGPGECSVSRGGGDRFERLDLSVDISERGFAIAASGGVLPEGCAASVTAQDLSTSTVPIKADAATCTNDQGYPTKEQRAKRKAAGLGAPLCAFDFDRLRSCFQRIKDEYPTERSIIVGSGKTIDFQTLVSSIDAAREGPDLENRLSSSRYYQDDLLFDQAFLFVGDDLNTTCHPPRPARPINEGPIGLGRGPGPGFNNGSSPSVPTIRTGTASVRGSLSKEVIRRYIRRHINQIRFCYEQQLARQPDLNGRVAVRFVISSSGAVSSSSVASSTLGDPTAETCIARAVQRIAFPQPEGGGVVIVTYPFMFQSAEEP